MINISKEAINAIKGKYNFDEKDKNVRVFVKGIGWGGPKFGITLDCVKENDEVKKMNDLSIIVEKNLLEIYGGFDIDFLDSWIGKDFVVLPTMGGSTC